MVLFAEIKERFRYAKASAHLYGAGVVEGSPRELLTLLLCLNIVQVTVQALQSNFPREVLKSWQ